MGFASLDPSYRAGIASYRHGSRIGGAPLCALRRVRERRLPSIPRLEILRARGGVVLGGGLCGRGLRIRGASRTLDVKRQYLLFWR